LHEFVGIDSDFSKPQAGHVIRASVITSETVTPTVNYHALVEQIRAAYEALGTGDVEPLIELMHPDLEWRGLRRSEWRFWEPRPS